MGPTSKFSMLYQGVEEFKSKYAILMELWIGQ